SALAHHALVSHYRGEHQEALRDLTIALEFHRRSSTTRKLAGTLRGIALVETALGAHPDTIEHAGQALSTVDEVGLELAMTHNCLGWAHFNAGQLAEAEA